MLTIMLTTSDINNNPTTAPSPILAPTTAPATKMIS